MRHCPRFYREILVATNPDSDTRHLLANRYGKFFHVFPNVYGVINNDEIRIAVTLQVKNMTGFVKHGKKLLQDIKLAI